MLLVAFYKPPQSQSGCMSDLWVYQKSINKKILEHLNVKENEITVNSGL